MVVMSTASARSYGKHRQDDYYHQGNGALEQEALHARRRPSISHNDAYLYALRVAYLAYLLQPRTKRTQQVPAPATPVQRSSTSVNDLMKDFSLVRDSKSTRFPHGFTAELEKRITGILMGKEKRPEYNDAAVKRSFAAFFNAFSEPNFKKRMEKDRRVEDLVLIFFSNATKELSKGKPAGEDSWKLMVDRHLALFVRLVSLVLKDHDWARDRPELSSRLAVLESKLLSHDQDLLSPTARGGSAGPSTIEVVVPLSYEVKDMPLVQTVGRLFGLRSSMMQSDIDKFKETWTEKAALQDLKSYQTLLNVGSGQTLRPDDFDLDSAYDTWKKGEAHDLSQMMLAIIQANPELAKSTSSGLPKFNTHLSNGHGPQPQYPDALRRTDSNEVSSYVIDQPVDMSGFDAGVDSPTSNAAEENQSFTFVPPNTRGYFRFILAQALSNDINEGTPEAEGLGPASKLLSKQSAELLNEIALRWRVPLVSRAVLFMDVVRERFVDQEFSLDNLDAAFNLVKASTNEKGKASLTTASLSDNHASWPLADIALNQKVLSNLHLALLRDLFEALQQCYGPKPPNIGPVMLILEEHIQNDPNFSESEQKAAEYRQQMHEGLSGRAYEIYREFLEKEVPNDQNAWEFVHVIDLGKAVTNLLHKMQKRYRKNSEIMGYESWLSELSVVLINDRINPLTALVETILPLYAQDAKGIVERITNIAKQKEEEIPVEDGFVLYAEMVDIRQIHGQVLPGWVSQFTCLNKPLMNTESRSLLRLKTYLPTLYGDGYT